MTHHTVATQCLSQTLALQKIKGEAKVKLQADLHLNPISSHFTIFLMIKKTLNLLVLAGILCLENSARGGLHSGVVDLPWMDELCCESRSAHSSVEGDAVHMPQTNGSQASLPDDPQCSFQSLMSKLHPRELSGRRVFFRIFELHDSILTEHPWVMQVHGCISEDKN